MRWASPRSTASAAFSTRLTTSPMPRIREAIRSGWNGSKSSSFSPMPANLIGLPVTDLRLRAAPPRASPSSFVRIEPVIFSAWSKCVATLTASWPVAASSTSNVSWGLIRSRNRTNSCTSGSSICSRPAVSKMSVFRLFALAKASASRAILRTSVSPLCA